ncbi:hypothetical protein GGX14DRAFT_386322 [Mycena pura]|uniref:Uncharacterized protein n=1 Tax=Mycena pura TaxID=153505 RepID=A0AAD7E2S8_9AGAR|nr:hypothetical protein GGX14DRAFT_386322 [Mycena pura]
MWYSCIPLALAVRYTSPSRRSITHSVGAHVADVLATSKARGGRGRTAVGVDTPGVSIRAGVDAGRGRVFRVTQTPRRGGDRTAVGAWTRAGVPCDETPRKGVGRRWGAWTRRVWVGAWAFARAGMDTWHGRAFRATQTPCGGGGVSGMRHEKGDRGQGARTWRSSTGSSTTQRQNAPKDGGSHVRDAGWWRRASQAATAPGIDNEAP